MTHDHRDDDYRIFAALRFVNAHRIRQRQLIQLSEVILDAAVVFQLHGQRLRFTVDIRDRAAIAVENLQIVVVAHLQDLIAQPEQAIAKLFLRLAFGGWVKCGLQRFVQIAHAALTVVHRGQHLNIRRLKAKLAGDATGDQIDDQIARFLGVVFDKHEEVIDLAATKGHLTFVNPRGIGRNRAGGRLPKYLIKPCHRHLLARD